MSDQDKIDVVIANLQGIGKDRMASDLQELYNGWLHENMFLETKLQELKLEIETLQKEVEEWKTIHKVHTEREVTLQNFKKYVHERLDKAGVPVDPEPENNAAHGCRIEGRLNFIFAELQRLRALNEAADEVIENAKSIIEMECDSGGVSDFDQALSKYNSLKQQTQQL